MSGEDNASPPSVMWAQRATTVLLTICLEDCSEPKIDLKADSLDFSGIGGPDKKAHKLSMQFFKAIDPDKSVVSPRDRVIELVLKKKDENASFWPRLTSDKVKHHWLKVDFNKWKDEDDSEDDEGAAGEADIEKMMKNMSRMSAGADEKLIMDDLNAGTGSDDSDEEAMPDLE